jgi:hypothetical protein
MSVSKEKIKFRIENHLCTRCGLDSVDGKKMCAKHLLESAEKEKRKRERRSINCLCIRCGKQNLRENKKTCEDCVKSYRKYGHKKIERYYKNKSKGLCVRCSSPSEKIHCIKCQEYMKQKDKNYYSNFKENNLCVYCGQEKNIEGILCSECKINNKIKGSKSRLKKKETIFHHYGLECSCCGESNLAFLQIDHINNDGAKHRKVLRKNGTTLYRWLIKNNFPEGYQTLCANCNIARYHNGGICPHQQRNNNN